MTRSDDRQRIRPRGGPCQGGRGARVQRVMHPRLLAALVAAALAASCAAPAAYADGQPIVSLEYTVEIDGTAISDLADTSFGLSADVIGDLDGNGVPDIAVGAPSVHGSAGTGNLYVLLMDPGASIKSTVQINGDTPNVPDMREGARFGSSVAALGDLDGDGVPDVAVGAPDQLLGSVGTGDVYVIFLNPDATVKRTAVITGGTPNGPHLAVGDNFGASAAGIGDVDGDGNADLAVGAPGSYYFSLVPGDVHVIFLNPDGTVKGSAEITGGAPNGPAVGAGANLGASLAATGDLDGDGVPDMAVGAPRNLGNTTSTGSVHVMFMNQDGTVKRTADVVGQRSDGSPLANGDHFGASLAATGDLDGDGNSDLLVGATGASVAGIPTGTIHVAFLNPDGTVKRTSEINSLTPNGPESLMPAGYFGVSVVNLGDLNGDGLEDIAAGTFNDEPFYVMYMGPGGTVLRTVELTSKSIGIPSVVPVNHFGAAVANLGDLDSDGVADMAVGAPGAFSGGIGTGDLFILFMNPDGTAKRTAQINGETPGGPSLAASGRFGTSVEAVGDMDGDGVTEVAVGSTISFVDGANTGTLHVLFLNPDGTVKRTAEINGSSPNGPQLTWNDLFGSSVASLGDLDGDGVTDMAVGAPDHANLATSPGDLYIMLMNPDGTVKRTAAINGGTPNGPSVAPGDLFGISVENIGDLDGDGVTDLAVGATGHLSSPASVGAVHILFMNPDGTVKRTAAIDSETPNGPSLAPGDKFGTSIAAMGDLDGDGSAEIAVGASGRFLGGVSTGDVYLLFLNPDGTVKRTAAIDSETPNGPSLVERGYFGFSVASMGDLDGDGTVEVAAGASGSSRVYVMSAAVTAAPGGSFVTTWKTESPGESITIPVGGATGAYAVDWGDGSTSTHSGDASHAYASPGTYTVQISGDFTRIHLGGDHSNAAKLRSIEQWGTASWATMESAFSGASNMVYRAADAPDLSGVTDASSMFALATAFNGDISSWDVSSVTDMSRMFFNAVSFDRPLDSWDVSSVTDMSHMFDDAISFNGDISSWDVSSVTDMSWMFFGTLQFNQPIGSWDVSSVTDMGSMFSLSPSFNQPIGAWDTSGVTDMSYMFTHTHAFDQPIGSWDVSSVTDMSFMFLNSESFDQPLGPWDVSGVTDMPGMFLNAESFNQPIGTWDVSSVTDMYGLFAHASSFNQPLDTWDVSSVTDMSFMFANSTFFNQPLHTWDVSSAADMSGMFLLAVSFDQPLDSWDVSSVAYMPNMFDNAYSFNQPLHTWDVSSVADMSHMFRFAALFDQPLDSWDVSSAADMSGMFRAAFSFDQNLGSWYVVLGDTEVDSGDSVVTTVSAQNQFLDWQDTEYSIAATGDGDLFEMSGNVLRSTSPEYEMPSYDVTIVSTGGFGPPSSVDVTITVAGYAGRAPTSLGGTVFSDDNGNGAQDPGEPGRAGLAVLYVDVADFSKTGRVATDPSGKYAFADIPAGDYLVQVDGSDLFSYLTVRDGRAVTQDFAVPPPTPSYEPFASAPHNRFITTWETSSAGESITIPVGGAAGRYTVEWGDGGVTTHEGDASHAYASPGIYTVQVYGDFNRIQLGGDHSNAAKLRSIEQWGTASWTTMESAFSGASNMVYRAADAPDLSGVTDASAMFALATAFNGDISSWDVSSVTDMSYMFFNAVSFDQPLGSWDVSSVTDMSSMFDDAISFNGDISSWDVSSVTDMSYMLFGTTTFNQDISSWDVSSVTSTTRMFALATAFNGDISSWDVSSVTDASYMFFHAHAFNQPIGSWDVSSVTDASYMFLNAISFDQPIGTWDVSSATDMSGMFLNAESFNQPIGSWDTSGVTDMSSMFTHAAAFDQPIGTWDVSSVTDMSYMFLNAMSFDQPLGSWDVSSVTDMSYMFRSALSFDQPLGSWDVSSATGMARMFSLAASFNQPLSSWDVSSVTDMSGMFLYAFAFDQPLNSWDVSSATDMRGMFGLAHSFDQNLGDWYIVPAGTSLGVGDTVVTDIAAQNAYLDRHAPAYSIAAGGDGDLFEVCGSTLKFASTAYAKPSYDITLVSEGGFSSPNSRDVTVTVRGDAGGGAAAVRGTVFGDANGNGVRDPGEAGIAGYSMYATDLANPEAVLGTTTCSDGTYAFEGLTPSGTTLVQAAYFPPGHTITTGQSYAYVLPEAGAPATFDVGFRQVQPSETVTLGVTAYLDGNANGTPDAGEPAIPGVTVFVYTYATGELGLVTTGADGTASKAGITPADFVAQVILPQGFSRATSPVDPASGVAGALTASGPEPGSTIQMAIGLVPSG